MDVVEILRLENRGIFLKTVLLNKQGNIATILQEQMKTRFSQVAHKYYHPKKLLCK
jgi:hypothetical protein